MASSKTDRIDERAGEWGLLKEKLIIKNGANPLREPRKSGSMLRVKTEKKPG